jgi:hypothetical protein
MGLRDEGEGSSTSMPRRLCSRFDFVVRRGGARTDEKRVILQVIDRKGVGRKNKVASMVTGFRG